MSSNERHTTMPATVIKGHEGEHVITMPEVVIRGGHRQVQDEQRLAGNDTHTAAKKANEKGVLESQNPGVQAMIAPVEMTPGEEIVQAGKNVDDGIQDINDGRTFTGIGKILRGAGQAIESGYNAAKPVVEGVVSVAKDISKGIEQPNPSGIGRDFETIDPTKPRYVIGQEPIEQRPGGRPRFSSLEPGRGDVPLRPINKEELDEILRRLKKDSDRGVLGLGPDPYGIKLDVRDGMES